MATLTWDQVGEREYEVGLDRGVLFFPEGGGVSWNGLISVQEELSTDVKPVYFDGQKINDIATVGDFAFSLTAFTYPEEFLRFEGSLEDQSGILITGQPPETFHMCYRTKVGNDVNQDAGYKIHILWNLLAVPSDKEHISMSDDQEAVEFQWKLTAVPEYIDRFRPTPYVVIDTRKVDPLLVAEIEELLYGTEDTEPRLPTLKSFTTFIRKWDRLIITDNGDGTWTASSTIEGYINMVSPTQFEITAESAIYLDPETYTIESTEKNEDDLWLP